MASASSLKNSTPSGLEIGLVDYGRGNLRSVQRALQTLDTKVSLLSSIEQWRDFDGIVLPGVGAFGDCIAGLHQRGFWHPLQDWLSANRPFLGICLGFQILFEESEESPGIPGFGFWKGKVCRFPSQPGLKIPHIGWNELILGSPCPLFRNLPEGSYVYFVHSYRPQPENPTLVTAWCEYGGSKFAAAAGAGNIHAVQFHPEKSQTVGLRILQNFLELVASQKCA